MVILYIYIYILRQCLRDGNDGRLTDMIARTYNDIYNNSDIQYHKISHLAAL